MLLERIEEFEEYRFVTNDSRGLHVGFFRHDPANPEVPVNRFWVRECGDPQSLKAMLRWLSVRRAEWPKWGRIAETIDEEAFARHMDHLMEVNPVAQVIGTTITKGDDPRELILGESLATQGGPRSETLYVHRFASASARERFFEWLETDDNVQQIEALVNIAKGSGTAALGEALEDLAK